MKKAILHKLQQRAQELPPRTETIRHTEFFTAQEFAEAAEKFGREIPAHLPKKIYPVTSSKIVSVNHFEKLKQAYQKSGWAGVEDYCTKVNNTGIASTDEGSETAQGVDGLDKQE